MHWRLPDPRETSAQLCIACTRLRSPATQGRSQYGVLLIEELGREAGADPRGLHGWYGLTPTLAQVAGMLSQGLTPGQIAD